MTLPTGLPPQPPEIDLEELKKAAESILLVSSAPVTVEQLVAALETTPQIVHALLWELQQDYAVRGVQIQSVAGGFQLCTRPELAPYVQRFLQLEHREPLSRAALETLAIIAYRQPTTRAEIEAVRGVRSEHVLERLLERHLVREVGRKAALGRPILYGTTEGFLRYFGLKDLHDLPTLDSGDPRGALVVPPAQTATGSEEHTDE